MGWLPSAPQLRGNPLDLVAEADAAGKDPVAHAVEKMKSGELQMACENPDDPANFPRNHVRVAPNILGSSGEGHEYFLKYLLGHAERRVSGDEAHAIKPTEVTREDDAAEGKLDLLVTLDFRMCTTALYSDIVLPTATWYEKDDLNTSDMHPFIHPLSGSRAAVVGTARPTGRSTSCWPSASARSAARTWASAATLVADAADARHPENWARPSSRARTGSWANATWCRARPLRR